MIPSTPKTTSTTRAPVSASRRLNAVVARTPSSPQRSLSFEHPAACRNDGRAGPSTPAQARPKTPRENIPAPPGDSGLSRSTQTSGDPDKEGRRREDGSPRGQQLLAPGHDES